MVNDIIYWALIIILYVFVLVLLIKKLIIPTNKISGGYNQLQLAIQDPWLFYIQNGEKTVEGRKGSSDKFTSWIGKEVSFFNSRRKIPVRVTAVRHYSDLYQYLDEEGYDKVLPGVKSRDDAIKIYHGFYSDELIKSVGGMNAIEIELIH